MTRVRQILKDEQIIYTLLPLLLLIACLVLFNLFVVMGRQVEATPPPTITREANGTAVTATAVPEPTTPAPGTDPSPSPTATPTSAPTATPLPTVPTTAAITLLGPPPEAVFSLEDSLTFYWQWPEPLPESSVFRLYLEAGEREVSLGEVAEPNVGRAYRLRIRPADFLAGSGTATWQVRLETAEGARILLASETRSLQFRSRP